MKPAHYNRELTKKFVGFGMCVILTIVPYLAVQSGTYAPTALVITICGLAFVQLMVQLTFFLHVGNEDRPFWRSLTLFFAAIVAATIVGGSIWIMANLNYNMLSSHSDNAVIKDEGIMTHHE